MNAIDGRSSFIAIFGWPLSYTLSPIFQNAGLAAAGLNAVYIPFPVRSGGLTALWRGLKVLPNFLGANVTNPHKLAALRLADALTPEARAVGAVNTLYRRGRRWIGHNTDAEGFLRGLRRYGVRLRGKHVALLGAGGAARAVAWACLRAGAERLSLACRRPTQGRALARRLGRAVEIRGLSNREIRELARDCDLLVNTVPGAAFAARIGRCLPRRRAVAAEVNYVPPETPLLKAARARGWKAVNGLAMLLEQGALSFERFTGRPAPRRAMQAAIDFGGRKVQN